MTRNNLVERLARAMCSAEGVDPDKEVHLAATEMHDRPRPEDVMLHGSMGPAWKRHARQARLHAAASQVMSLEMQSSAAPTTGSRP